MGAGWISGVFSFGGVCFLGLSWWRFRIYVLVICRLVCFECNMGGAGWFGGLSSVIGWVD